MNRTIEEELEQFKKLAYTRHNVEEGKRVQFIEKVLRVSKRVFFQKGSCILNQQQTNDNVYILLSGICDLIVNGEKLVSLKRRGDIVGANSIINQMKNLTVVTAKTDVNMLTIHKDIVLGDPEIASLLAICLAQKLDWTLQKSKDENGGKIKFLENEIQVVKAFLQSEKVKIESLQASYEEIKKADQLKTEIIQNMNHELRTPLNGIMGFSELISSGSAKLSRDEIKEYADIIKDSGESLLGLVNNLIDMASLKSGTANFILSKNNLYEHTCMVLNQYADQILKKSINIKFLKPPKEVFAVYDEERVSQVISNLISNAIKYSLPSGEVIIAIEKKDGKVLFSIRDHGCGIPKNEIEHIFSGFAQSSRTKDGSGGRALGLAISRSIMESHEELIWAEHPENGEGALFKFSLDNI